MRKLWISLAILLSFYANVEASYQYTPEHKHAYDLILAMRFDEAIVYIEDFKAANPDDLLIYHIENYIDFIGIFISEEEVEFRLKEPNKAIRLAKLKKGDVESPLYLFSQAELHLQWALTRVKFKEYFTAAREVNKAIGMLERNQERFPDFISNKKSLSLLHALVGTLPDRYKGVVSLVSNFNGTILQGVTEIDEVLEQSGSDYFFLSEAVAIKSMIMLHLQNKKQEAWTFLLQSSISKQDDPMSTFIMASTAMKCERNEEAIKILQERTRSPRFYPFYYLDLMLGACKLSRQDKNADIYLRSYVQNFSGQDYFKDAYRKLAWHALTVLEDKNLYEQYMTQCEVVGMANTDEDKSALKEALEKLIPQTALLRARLLYDGGYFARAREVLEQLQLEGLADHEQIEFLYRNARIAHSSGNLEDANLFYARCLNSDSDSRLYYRCNSALQLGIIYEEKGNRQLARQYFNTCLTMNPSEYKMSIHQKAKSGLNRIKI